MSQDGVVYSFPESVGLKIRYQIFGYVYFKNSKNKLYVPWYSLIVEIYMWTIKTEKHLLLLLRDENSVCRLLNLN